MPHHLAEFSEVDESEAFSALLSATDDLRNVLRANFVWIVDEVGALAQESRVMGCRRSS